MTGSPDELLVGALCLLVVVPWIGWTIRRGVGAGWLPIGQGHLERAERPGAFGVLLAIYSAAAVGIAFIGLDLLFGIAG